jgi:CheY-like chemotaxis protein
LAKIGILIIEDDEANQSALRQLLDSEGWQVRVVPVVRQALGELSSDRECRDDRDDEPGLLDA